MLPASLTSALVSGRKSGAQPARPGPILGRNHPDCEIIVIYEAGFQGFRLHDYLELDGIDCIVMPANKVTQEKDNRVKTDKVDARRLARNLENGDYSNCWVPDRELREDRRVSRTLTQIQRVIVA